MSWLIDHWFYAFLIWTVLAVAFGFGLAKVMAYADAAEQEWSPERDTAVLDWANAPAEWADR